MRGERNSFPDALTSEIGALANARLGAAGSQSSRS